METVIWKGPQSLLKLDYHGRDYNYPPVLCHVNTERYSGSHTFFLPIIEIERYVEALESMYTSLDGELYVQDYESPSKIVLKKSHDKWCIIGFLDYYSDGNSLNFQFAVDQSVIAVLLSFFKRILTVEGRK